MFFGVFLVIVDFLKVSYVSRLGGVLVLFCFRIKILEFRLWFFGCYCWWIFEVKVFVDRFVMSSFSLLFYFIILYEGVFLVLFDERCKDKLEIGFYNCFFFLKL